MKIITLIISVWLVSMAHSAPYVSASHPSVKGSVQVNSADLCATAQNTLAYLAKGSAYDPQVIHAGTIAPIPLGKIKATLIFICQHQSQMKDPAFIEKHFDFIRWTPDIHHARQLAANKPLLQHLPADKILMTKYYVHLAKAQSQSSPVAPFALYALPPDEVHLTMNEANTHPELTRFKYGKHAILRGALHSRSVFALAYLSRDDLETALLQGTVVADFGSGVGKKIFNVHRHNNISYDRTKTPYAQERYWYFKQVDGVKGYGKDAEYKITVCPGVTFAADLAQLGLGKLLMIQYSSASGILHSQIGILADTGGAFADNLYQIDYLAGAYPGNKAFYQATHHLPDYVDAYFMVLKS